MMVWKAEVDRATQASELSFDSLCTNFHDGQHVNLSYRLSEPEGFQVAEDHNGARNGRDSKTLKA